MNRLLLNVIVCITFLCMNVQSFAQNKLTFKEINMSVAIDTNKLYGTLTLPDTKKACPIVLIIAGSGQTDRDCNQPSMKSNAYKQVAENLAEQGIATLRYDKRGVGESVFMMSEGDLRFDDFVDDAILWINLLKADKRFSKLIIAGHSEGSLIGMIASQKTKVNAYISIAGAGKSIDEILKLQLKTAIPDSAYYIKSCLYLDTLKSGIQLTNSDPALASLFRESIQPYMINWMKYDPSVEIKKLNMPILILQGENDIQVEVANALQLAEANKKAKIKIIKGMNHPLKLAEKDREKNFATYSDPTLPVVQNLIDEIKVFILELIGLKN